MERSQPASYGATGLSRSRPFLNPQRKIILITGIVAAVAGVALIAIGYLAFTHRSNFSWNFSPDSVRADGSIQKDMPTRLAIGFIIALTFLFISKKLRSR